MVRRISLHYIVTKENFKQERQKREEGGTQVCSEVLSV